MFSVDKKIRRTKMKSKSLSSIGFLWLLLFAVCRDADAIRNRVCQIDIGFVIDSSSTIWGPDFGRQINFVKDFVSFLDIGKDQTRVAAVTFSEKVTEVLKFSDLQTKEQVLQRLGDIKHEAGKATRTFWALEYVHDTMFATKNGERPDALDVVVVLTDGKTNAAHPGYLGDNGKEQTQIEAAEIKRKGAYVFAIGIGNDVDMDELNGISSDPDDRFTITVDSFSELDSDEIKKLLYQRACQDLPPPPPPPPTTCAQPCTCQCPTRPPVMPPPPPGPPPPPPSPPRCTKDVGDIFFVLDQSSSIHSDDTFQEELTFVKNVISQFDIGPKKVQVGALKFSTNPEMQFYLNTFKTKASIEDKISQIKWKGGDTYLAKALRMVRTQGMVPEHGSRAATEVPQIVVVITDAVVHDEQELRRELQTFHQQNYITFAIGVGKDIDYNRLPTIANSKDHMFNVKDLYELHKIKDELVRVVCDSLRP